MNNIIIDEKIENKIYEINGVEVMLDSDLANLYHVETKRINEAVIRNKDKFPIRFSWQLSIDETNNLSRSQFATLNIKRGNNIKYGARVFTEQGVYMLATILKSKEAIKVTIAIMDAFVKMRHYINYNKDILPNKILLLEDKVDEHENKINELFDKFNPLDITKDYIYFKGQFYDAYSKLLDIFDTSKEEIIIIDNYAGKELLNIIKNINNNFVIVSSNIDDTLKNKYESQYNNVKFILNKDFHDRFIIIDRKYLYMCGSSFKDLGKKCFYIGEIQSIDILNNIINNIFT